MQGTPGFVLNGIPVKGAYPTSHFIGIVDELKKEEKLSFNFFTDNFLRKPRDTGLFFGKIFPLILSRGKILPP